MSRLLRTSAAALFVAGFGLAGCTPNAAPAAPTPSASAAPVVTPQAFDGGDFTLKIPNTWKKADLSKLDLPSSELTKPVAAAVNGSEETPETMLVVYGATFPAEIVRFPAAVDVMKKTYSAGGNTIKKEFKNTSGDVFGFTVGLANNPVDTYVFMARNGDKWYVISVVTGGSVKEDDVLTLVNSFQGK